MLHLNEFKKKKKKKKQQQLCLKLEERKKLNLGAEIHEIEIETQQKKMIKVELVFGKARQD